MAILKKKTQGNLHGVQKDRVIMPKSVTLSTKVLKIDESYQRLIDHSMVHRIRDNFDPDLFQSLIVSEREGEYHIVDGGHRFCAIKDAVKEVPCILWQGLTYEQECEKFRKLNTNRRSLNASVVFHSMVREGDADATDVVRVMRTNGFTYNRYNQTSKENMIGSPSKMLKLYRANGVELLDRTLNICRKAWHGTKNSLLTTMLTGLHTFLTENTDIDDKILIKALSKVEPKLIKGQAAYYITADTITGLSGSSCRYTHIANVIKDHYNKQAPKSLQIA